MDFHDNSVRCWEFMDENFLFCCVIRFCEDKIKVGNFFETSSVEIYFDVFLGQMKGKIKV